MPGSDSGRLAALRRFSPADIAELLRRVPDLTDALAGTGPLAPMEYAHGRLERKPLPAKLSALAAALDSRPGVFAVVAGLDRFHVQLLALAVWHDGQLTREQVLAEAGPDAIEALEAGADTLERLLLVDRSRAWLTLRAGVAGVVGLPGTVVRPFLEYLSTDQLAERLRLLGQRAPGKKHERVDALEASLRDGETIKQLLATAPEEAVRVLRLLLEQGPQHLTDLGEPSHGFRHGGPVAWLWSHSLVFLDEDGDVRVWLDVEVAVRGVLYASWDPNPPPIQPRPLATTAWQLPPVLSQLAALLDLWAADPAPALASGGLGVRPIRAAAKTLGLPAGTVGLLAHLAVHMDLLGTVQTGTRGRRRDRTAELAYAPTPLAAAFGDRPPAERWVRLVHAWRHDLGLDEVAGLPERVDGGDHDPHHTEARQALLAVLADLPTGHGVATDELVGLAGFAYPGRVSRARVGGIVDAARVLGLIPPDGPVGLTALGRAALSGVDAVADALPAPSTAFTVQADHTIVAPPDLAPELTAALERYAVCESDAGARVYRVDETRLAHALDDGETAEGITAFLTDHATAPIAQNVTHLISDVASRHGRLRAGSCQSYVRSEDPSLLARAAAVKPAKLRTVAPTVAVSELPRGKLVAALRAKGLMPVAEGADGATLVDAPTVADSAWDADDALPDLPAPATADVDADVLAERIVDNPEGGDGADGRGGALMMVGGQRL